MSRRTFSKTVAIKAVDEANRTATGAVLVPNELDRQGDFLRPAAVERFHNDTPDTGVMHAAFPDAAATLTRSEVLDTAEELDGAEYPAGTWMATRQYEDDDLWQLVKDGVLTGFSIGGTIDAGEEHDAVPDDVRVPDEVEFDTDEPVTELVDGTVEEVSDVDIPAVPRATYKGEDLGKSVLEQVDGEDEFVSLMTEQRGHSESDARRLYQYLTDNASGKEDTKMGKNIDDPEYSAGDAVQWTWQSEPVHGRVSEVGEQFTVAGNTITGEEDEAVYLIHDWDEQAEAFDVDGTAKPQSSLSPSQMDMPTVDEADTKAVQAVDDATLGARLKRLLFGRSSDGGSTSGEPADTAPAVKAAGGDERVATTLKQVTPEQAAIVRDAVDEFASTHGDATVADFRDWVWEMEWAEELDPDQIVALQQAIDQWFEDRAAEEQVVTDEFTDWLSTVTDTDVENYAPDGDTSDKTMTDSDNDGEAPAWAEDLTAKVDSIDERVSEIEGDDGDDAEKSLADAPEWAEDLAKQIDDLNERVDAISTQSGRSQQLGKSTTDGDDDEDEEDEEKFAKDGFTLDPRKAGGGN